MFKKKDNRTLNKSIDILRIVILAVLFCAVILLFVFKIFELQILKGDYYSEIAVSKNYKEQTVKTSRGQIYDRYGNVLVSNVKSYNVVVDSITLDKEKCNEVLLSFVDFCDENGIELSDSLPVTNSGKYVLDEDYIFDDKKTSALNKFISDNELQDKNFLSEDEALYDYLCERYGISESEKNKENVRKLVGVRYDMETNDFEYITYYTLLSDIDENTRVLISENLHMFHGIKITTTDKRYYNCDSLASHILGRTGTIYAEEVDEYVKQKGYSYDAVIGKDGAEKAFEEYLHGTDGVVRVALDEDNNVVEVENVKDGTGGYSVMLTLDSNMQRVAEEALKDRIDFAREQGQKNSTPNTGEDCNAGSVVVMKPKTGEVLVCASYPGFDLNTFSENFTSLSSDTERRPLVNRATQGIYPPGSTFKIVSAIAGLCEKIITPDTLIYDSGVYRAYEDYSPHCWIYDNTGSTHGYVNVKSAIEKSCNYFFYQIGDEMGIDAITHYASLLGLGEKTGIEVSESSGILASPEYRDERGLLWNPGDTLQAAIGQSDNAFTPIQLCSYMCAVVNGGTRYKATLLNSVVDFYTGEKVYEHTPKELSHVDLPQDTVELLKSAMKSVVVDGTARNVFDNYEYEIGGKTGTAQVSGGSDTALFVGFAPYDDPEIVVSVVVENAYQSSRASEVAKSVFDYYFSSLESEEE